MNNIAAHSPDDPLNNFLSDFLSKFQESASSSSSSTLSDELSTIKELLGRQDFRALVHLHSIVSEYRLKESAALETALGPLLDDVLSLLGPDFSSTAKELQRILSSRHFHSLVSAYDDVANRHYEPQLPDVPYQVDEDDGVAVKVVKLIKNSDQALGATIKVVETSGAVFIARVLYGGVAYRSGCIHVGDQVLDVNDIPVTGKSPAEVVKILAASNGTVTFRLIPADAPLQREDRSNPEFGPKTRHRALFDYDPREDSLSPCADAGLAFKRGDILQIVSADDAHWWQAKLESPASEGGIASSQTHSSIPPKAKSSGLIPSKLLCEKLQKAKSPPTPRSENGSLGSRKSDKTVNSKRSSVKKVMYEANNAISMEFDSSSEAQFYEEVSRLYPRSGFCRPIVLIGPPAVGRNELKRRLLLLNPNRFATTVPHTSRARRPGELNGVEYNFVSRDEMELLIQDARCIEYGEYKGNYYGTLIDSVTMVTDQGRICVLNPHPQALARLRTPALKAYVIFIKPPPLAVLKETRQTSNARSTSIDSSYSRGFSEQDFGAMIESASKLSAKYGAYFDCTITNGDIDVAFRELCEVIDKVESQPSWVPSQWIR